MPKDEKMSGNKGEWSELYTFLKLLYRGRVYAADNNAEKIENVYFTILKIIREEDEKIDYVIGEENIELQSNGKMIMTVPRSEFEYFSDRLFEKILTGSGSFEVRDVCEFANGILVTKLKASSSQKADILMQMQDIHSGFVMNEGFSIKSEVGSPPTLINASQATNFVFMVTGISPQEAEKINAINTSGKIKARLTRIRESGGQLKFFKPANKTMERNLRMLDGDLPKLIGEMLLCSYMENLSDCISVLSKVCESDPLGLGKNSDGMYELKFKRFLYSFALGMRPKTLWNGRDEANGGYLIVKDTGEILAYTLYNRDAFQDYLLDNTIFERPSTTRHDYMKLYMEDGEMYLKLNLQVRFC